MDANQEYEGKTQETVLPREQHEINPEMVVMARLAAGLTQTECAGQIGVSQAKLSKVEDGLSTTLDGTAIAELARISGYPVDFFSQPGAPVSLGEGFFRKRASVPAKVFNRIEALINIKRMEIGKLIKKVDHDYRERPEWEPDEFKEGSREIARHLRHFWQIPKGPIKDLVEIVEDAGCIVIYFDFGTPKVDGLTVRCQDGTPIILLNPNVSMVRQRSTLAHELGHVIMHRIPSGEMEDEAFDFASEFMMPEAEIRPALFPLNEERLVRLKLKWRVSIQWILKWANKLGALKDGYYRVLMMRISQKGWRKVEPFDSEWPIERPSMLKEIVDYFLKDLQYSEGDLCRAIKANIRTFSAEYLGRPTFSVV